MTSLDPGYVEELALAFKPRGLPTDIIVLHANEFRCNNIIRAMLANYIIVHDGLGLRKIIAECIST